MQHGGGNDVMLGKPLQPFDWCLTKGYKLYLCPAHKKDEKDEVQMGDCDQFELLFELERNYHGDTAQLTPEVAPQVANGSADRGAK